MSQIPCPETGMSWAMRWAIGGQELSGLAMYQPPKSRSVQWTTQIQRRANALIASSDLKRPLFELPAEGSRTPAVLETPA
jgi:hypothetical protein